MPAVIAVVLIAIVALAVLSFTVHVLLFPWLLVAIAILAWIKSGRAAPASNPSARPPPIAGRP